MYIAMGGERAANLQRPERSLLDKRVDARRRRGRAHRRGPPGGRPSPTACTLGYDHLVLATGSRIVPEAIEHFDTEAHHFYTAEAAARAARRARRVRGRADRHRHRRHALQVPAGAAGGRVPHRGRAARARPARQERARLLLAHRSRLHDRERLRDGDADPRAEGHRAAHLLQRRGDRPRAQGRPEPRGRGAAVRPAHPRAAAQGPAVPDRLGPGTGAGRLAADGPRHPPGRRPAERLRPR